MNQNRIATLVETLSCVVTTLAIFNSLMEDSHMLWYASKSILKYTAKVKIFQISEKSLVTFFMQLSTSSELFFGRHSRRRWIRVHMMNVQIRLKLFDRELPDSCPISSRLTLVWFFSIQSRGIFEI